ncbi:hypothetical protein ABZ801_41440 [Actinomadura sp. NPDC047616]
MMARRLARMIAPAEKGCPCCGGQGKVGGSQNRDCPTCRGTGKGASE